MSRHYLVIRWPSAADVAADGQRRPAEVVGVYSSKGELYAAMLLELDVVKVSPTPEVARGLELTGLTVRLPRGEFPCNYQRLLSALGYALGDDTEQFHRVILADEAGRRYGIWQLEINAPPALSMLGG